MKNNKKELVDAAKRLPIYSKLIYDLYKGSYMNKKQKILLSTAIGYLISPIELIPGFIPVAGQLDDIIIVLLILRKVLKSCDEKIAYDFLNQYQITYEIIDQDIKVCKRTIKNMALGTGKILGKILFLSGKIVLKGGKKLIKRKKDS